MARAVGDHVFNGGISALAEITGYTLQKGCDYYIFQGCDGVFDVMSSNHVGYFIYRSQQLGIPLDTIIKNLVAAAIETFHSGDNVTALLKKIRIPS